MRTNRITIVAFTLGWMLSAAIAAAVGAVISGQDKNTQPACTALSGNRNRLWFNESASGGDYIQACMVDASGNYAWNAVRGVPFTSTDNGVARFDGVTGSIQGSSATINDDGALTLTSSMSAVGDIVASDDVAAVDDIEIGDDLTFSSASGVTTFTTDHTWKDNAGNTMATLNDLGTTGRLDINGLRIGSADGRITNPDATGDFIEWNSGLEFRVENAKTFLWYENGGEILRLEESSGSPIFNSNSGVVILNDGLTVNGAITTLAAGLNVTGNAGATGYLQGLGVILTSGAEPGCVAGIRGQLWYVAGGAGVADTVKACTKDAADAYAWRALY